MIRPISQAQLQNISNPASGSMNRLANSLSSYGDFQRQNRLEKMQQQQIADQQARQSELDQKAEQQHRLDNMAKFAPVAVQAFQKALAIPDEQGRQAFFESQRHILEPSGVLDYDNIEPGDFSVQNLTAGLNQFKSLISQGGNGPANVQEWRFFNALSKDDQARYLNMKRNGINIKEVEGVQSLVDTNSQTVTPLSTLEDEAKAKATIEAQKAKASEEAKSNVQLKMRPKITKAIKEAEAAAASKGESLTDLQRAEAALPGLMEVVGKLNVLSDAATYTMAGKAFDFMAKELGFGATKGATARARMESLVNNQVLPLLKQTFGAAFTQEEGDGLRRTLLDIDAAPEVRKATLKSFIEQKMRDIDTKKREAGIEPVQAEQTADPLGIR